MFGRFDCEVLILVFETSVTTCVETVQDQPHWPLRLPECGSLWYPWVAT